MKVIDITYDDLERFYAALARKVFSDKNSYIAIVGIANSGLKLSDGLFKELRKNGFHQAQSFAVECKRPHSKYTDSASTSIMKRILKTLPRSFSNFLRIMEHHILGQMRPSGRIVVFREEANEKLRNFEHILVVDDAVDSGHSMKSVVNEIQKLAPRAKVESAAYVITQKKPVIVPNWYEYRDLIVRFPWAVDSQ